MGSMVEGLSFPVYKLNISVSNMEMTQNEPQIDSMQSPFKRSCKKVHMFNILTGHVIAQALFRYQYKHSSVGVDLFLVKPCHAF